MIPSHNQVDPQVCWSITTQESDLFDLVSLRSVVEVFDAVCNDLTTQVDGVFLAIVVLVLDLVQLEVELASVDSYEVAVVVDGSDWCHDILLKFVVDIARYLDDFTHEVIDDFPDFAHIIANGHHVLAILSE